MCARQISDVRFSVAIFRCELNQLAFFIDFIRVFKKCVALFIVMLFGPLFWVSAGHSPQSMVQSVHMLGVATLQQFLIINFEALPFNKKNWNTNNSSLYRFSLWMHCRNAIWHINTAMECKEMRYHWIKLSKISDSSEFPMEIVSQMTRIRTSAPAYTNPRLTQMDVTE